MYFTVYHTNLFQVKEFGDIDLELVAFHKPCGVIGAIGLHEAYGFLQDGPDMVVGLQLLD